MTRGMTAMMPSHRAKVLFILQNLQVICLIVLRIWDSCEPVKIVKDDNNYLRHEMITMQPLLLLENLHHSDEHRQGEIYSPCINSRCVVSSPKFVISGSQPAQQHLTIYPALRPL